MQAALSHSVHTLVQNTAAPSPPVHTAEVPASCSNIAGSVSAAYSGESRLRQYAERLKSLSDTDRQDLRRHVENYIRHMLQRGASDLDIGGPACNNQVWYRVDGDKRPDPSLGKYDMEEMDVLLLSLVNEVQQEELLEHFSADFSFQMEEDGDSRRFRATLYFDNAHVGLNMRAITHQVRPIRSLGFHPIIEQNLMFRYVRDGLTLVTGVTGSGKSSTLDAIVDANNQDTEGHIVVIGRPIEYIHASKKCIVRHREVGKDVRSFKAGIVQALRQDPDIIVIGEMRDPETISAALEVTDSGHKVFSTLHTSSAVESIDRIVGEYASDAQERIRNRLADTLRCIISQKLLPRLGGGRVLTKEVLLMTSPARAAIKNNNSGEVYQMIWEGTAQGMTTLEQDLYRLMRENQISPETAINFANNKRRLMQLIR